MSERRGARTSERENNCQRSYLCLWVLLFPLVLILSQRKLWGFLLYGFPKENSFCLLSLVIIHVHVILLDNILRSYIWLNAKNITQIILLSLKIISTHLHLNLTSICTFDLAWFVSLLNCRINNKYFICLWWFLFDYVNIFICTNWRDILLPNINMRWY